MNVIFTNTPIEFYEGIPLYFSEYTEKTQTQSTYSATYNTGYIPQYDKPLQYIPKTSLIVKSENAVSGLIENSIRELLFNLGINPFNITKGVDDKWEITIDSENIKDPEQYAKNLIDHISKRLNVPNDKISILYVVRNN